MRRIRLLQYHYRRFLLGTNPEEVFFLGAFGMLVAGLVLPGINFFLVSGGLLLGAYGISLALWWKNTWK